MSAATLERALRDLGIPCTVEAQDRLAVLIPAGDAAALEEPAIRRAALALIPAHGFTHLALDLGDPAPASAAASGVRSRDGVPRTADRAAVHRD